MSKLTVIDFFCGAGGFSEGFRQMGYNIIKGYDHWKPAIETFNHNFNTNSEVKNILDFEKSIDEINEIPDTDIIIGSPPCVSFSSSNKSGNADKSLGIRLTEAYLRIVAVKKHKPNSILKAWFMENVVNSIKFLEDIYTFKDLNLSDWAIKHGYKEDDVAIVLKENTTVINAANYGSFQARRRVFSGEIIHLGKLIIPKPTHSAKSGKNKGLLPYKTLAEISALLPTPFSKDKSKAIKDPQYNINIPIAELSDHFYDTGIYEVEWRFSRHWKTNHPYMGRMSFPENKNNPSRTITATRIANSRESIIYKSEIDRVGDGQYRLPTIREIAVIMGFPITFQFKGAENTKWRLVGNAVCATVSREFARIVLEELNIKPPSSLNIVNKSNLNGIVNLNDFKLKEFNNPPIKNKNAKFRWHTVKDGNMTVTLTNYNFTKKGKVDGKWYTSIQYGTGKGYPSQPIDDNYYLELEEIIKDIKEGKEYLKSINNGFTKRIANTKLMQKMYEKQEHKKHYLEPTVLVDRIADMLNQLALENELYEQQEKEIFKYKDEVPVKQLFALHAINKIASLTNTIK